MNNYHHSKSYYDMTLVYQHCQIYRLQRENFDEHIIMYTQDKLTCRSLIK